MMPMFMRTIFLACALHALLAAPRQCMAFSSTLSYTSADTSWFSAYLPNGTPLLGKFTSIRDVLDTLGVDDAYAHSYDALSATVYFRRLTATPLVILFMGKAQPTRIQEAIKSFNYTEYINSYSYYSEVRDMVLKGTLTRAYAERFMNKPMRTFDEELATDKLFFLDNNLMLEFSRGSDDVLFYRVQNFKAMQRCKLSIRHLQVTGRDYSIGFDVIVENMAIKPIKYLHFTVTARDPVFDLVRTTTAKAYGPIFPEEVGSYEFEDLIISRVAQYLEIDKIVITYMDMTTLTISKKDIPNITMVDWEEVGRRR